MKVIIIGWGIITYCCKITNRQPSFFHLKHPGSKVTALCQAFFFAKSGMYIYHIFVIFTHHSSNRCLPILVRSDKCQEKRTSHAHTPLCTVLLGTNNTGHWKHIKWLVNIHWTMPSRAIFCSKNIKQSKHPYKNYLQYLINTKRPK